VGRTAHDGLQALRSAPARQRLRLRGERRRLRKELEASAQEVTDLAKRERDARAAATRQREFVEPRIAEHRRHAAPLDDAEFTRLHAALETARRAKREADDRSSTVEEGLQDTQAELLAAEAESRPTVGQRRLGAC
jgi:hypothetical protein